MPPRRSAGCRCTSTRSLPYFLHYANDEQKQRWFPGFASGELIGVDRDDRARHRLRPGRRRRPRPSATATTTSSTAPRPSSPAASTPTWSSSWPAPIQDAENRRDGLTLLVVESGMPGFTRGRKLDKIGLQVAGHRRAVLRRRARPGAEPARRGGRGLPDARHNLPAGAALDRASPPRRPRPPRSSSPRLRPGAQGLRHSRSRRSRTPSSCWPSARPRSTAGQALVDRAILAARGRRADAADAAKAKLFCTEMQARVIDKCLQLHGGYGYMLEYPIARLYADARVSRIYGGTSEVMKSDHRQVARASDALPNATAKEDHHA